MENRESREARDAARHDARQRIEERVASRATAGGGGAAKARIVFVDDDVDLLAGLRVSLRRERRSWNMVFCDTGEAALEAVTAEPTDLFVTDMQMPGMDGAALLREVARTAPGCARVVLSGQADTEAALRAAPYAHQWFAKPIERDRLVAVMSDILLTRSLVLGGAARDAVTRADRLPVLPQIVDDLVRLLSDPEASVEDVAEVIEQEPAASVRVLQMANSAFFGLPRPIDDVREAVTFLGFGTIAQLVFAAEILERSTLPSGVLEPLVQRSLSVSRVAQSLVERVEDRRVAATGGLLHDVGKLVLLALDDGRQGYVEVLSSGDDGDIADFERSWVGATGAAIGAALLGVRGLPFEVVDAVARQEDDRPRAGTEASVAEAIRTARALVARRAWRIAGEPDEGAEIHATVDGVGSERLDALDALVDSAFVGDTSGGAAA